MRTRRVEYYRCWPLNGDRGSWDVDFIDIPFNTPASQVQQAIEKACQESGWIDTEAPLFVGLYSECGDE